MGNNNEKTNKYNHEDIIKWLESKFGNKGIYRDLEGSAEFQAEVEVAKKEGFIIYPRISIDLLRVVEEEIPKKEEGEILKRDAEKPKQIYDYTLFFAISCLKNIFKTEAEKIYLKKRLLFYQYYFSRITASERVRTIIVVPDNNDNIPSEFLKFLKDNKFGLWKIKIEEKGEKETVECEPKSFGTRMREEVDAFREDPEKTIKDSFFDKYLRSAVNTMAGVTSDMFGERYIDRKLLTKMLDLEKVEYGDTLKRLVNEQLDGNSSDYQFVTEVFNALWQKYIGIPYSKFLKTFEPVLLHVFAEGEEIGEKYYRDHYIHQFQVFLLGTYIIDKLYDDFKGCKCNNPEIKWLIASSFHDIGYPVQLYDKWSGDFFKDFFKIDIKIADLELKYNFVDKSFLSCMGYLIWELCRKHREDSFKDNWLADPDKREIVTFFHKEITEKKSHCILSSLSLLRLVQNFSFEEKNMVVNKLSKNLPIDKGNNKNIDDICGEIVEKVFVPSALAIALHDKELWQSLRKESEKDNHTKVFRNLEFEKDPLSFLLIFCDNIEEWGRPSKSSREKEAAIRMRFDLKELDYNHRTRSINVVIRTPDKEENDQEFEDKQEELRAMQFFLKQLSGNKFAIRLEDKNLKGETFEMKGSS